MMEVKKFIKVIYNNNNIRSQFSNLEYFNLAGTL